MMLEEYDPDKNRSPIESSNESRTQIGDGDIVCGTLTDVTDDGINDVQIEPIVPLGNFSSQRKFKLSADPAVSTRELERFVGQRVAIGVESIGDSVAEVIPIDPKNGISFSTRRFLEGYCVLINSNLWPGDSIERQFDTVLKCGQLCNWRDGEVTGVRLEPADGLVPGATYRATFLRLTPVQTDANVIWVIDARASKALSPPETGYGGRILVVHPSNDRNRQYDIPASLEQPRPTPTVNITVHEVTEQTGYELPESAVECRDWGLCPAEGNTVEARVTGDCRALALGRNNLSTTARQFLQRTFPVVDEESYEISIETGDVSSSSTEMLDIRSYDASRNCARAVVRTADRKVPEANRGKINGVGIAEVLSALTGINRLTKDVDIKREFPECKKALYDVKHYVVDELVRRRHGYLLAIRRESDDGSQKYSICFSEDVCSDELDAEELKHRVRSSDHDVWMYHIPRDEWPDGPPIRELDEESESSMVEGVGCPHAEAYRSEQHDGCEYRDTLTSAFGSRADPDTYLRTQNYHFAQVVEECL